MGKLLKQLIVVAVTITLLVLSPLVGLALLTPLGDLYASMVPALPIIGDIVAMGMAAAIWLGIVTLIVVFFRELASSLT